MGSEYQPEETQALVQSWKDDMHNILDSIEEERMCLRSDLTAERSFRKVWGSVVLLSFLYGLMYGVYLSK